MGGLQEMFKKYRFCLILSVMAVVLVVSALLFLQGEEEQPVKVYPETIEASEIFKAELPNTDPEPEQESMYETEESVTTEESVEPESEKMDATENEQENAVSITETEEMPECETEAEPIPESTGVSQGTNVPEETEVPEQSVMQESVQTTVPEQERIPQEEPEGKPPAEEEPEVPSSQEQEKVCTHSWLFDSYYQEPTCGMGGLENQTCAHCGATRTANGEPTGIHSFVVETAGTCCDIEVLICEDCHTRQYGQKDAGNHVDEEDGFCYACGQSAS